MADQTQKNAISVGTWPLAEGTYDPALNDTGIPDGAAIFGLIDTNYAKYAAPENIPGFTEVPSLEELTDGKYCVFNASSGFSYVIIMTYKPIDITVEMRDIPPKLLTSDKSGKYNFVYPFTNFSSLDLTNCFTSLYMHLENYKQLYDPNCKEFCCFCGMCSVPWGGVQTRLFFLFDTITGRSAAQNSWGNKRTAIFNEIYNTDETVDFLFGYAGYGYVKHTSDLADKIRACIDDGQPALVRLVNAEPNTFRLITAYTDNGFIQAKPEYMDNIPDEEPAIENIDALYQVTGKTERKYTLIDGLNRIKRVFEYNRDMKLWDEYINEFQHNDANKDKNSYEILQHFDIAKNAMHWNCHNFGMAMGVTREYKRVPTQVKNWIWDEWKNPDFLPANDKIGTACDLSHTRQWQIHALQKVCVKSPSEKHDSHTEWGLFECAVDAFKLIKIYDDEMYDGVCEMIDLLTEI